MAAVPGWWPDAPGPPIIGIAGKMGAGKDTLADEICRICPQYEKRKFATGLRVAAELLTLRPATRMSSEADKAALIPPRSFTPAEFAELVTSMVLTVAPHSTALHPIPVEAFKSLLCEHPCEPPELRLRSMTVGRLLQLLGTECFREHVGPFVWTNYMFRGWDQELPPKPLVISDVRFINEANEIRRRGGVVVLVARTTAERDDGRSRAHVSEGQLPPGLVDLVLENGGTPEELGLELWRALPALRATAAARAS